MLRDWRSENQAYRAPGPNLLLASTNNRLTVPTVYEAYPSWQGSQGRHSCPSGALDRSSGGLAVSTTPHCLSFQAAIPACAASGKVSRLLAQDQFDRAQAMNRSLHCSAELARCYLENYLAQKCSL